MRAEELLQVLVVLLLVLCLSNLCGWVFAKLHQPRVMGEILAGIVLGSSMLGRYPAVFRLTHGSHFSTDLLEFLYWGGLILLMFLAGAQSEGFLARDERHDILWLTVIGTGVPFVAALSTSRVVGIPSLAGVRGNPLSLTIVLATSVAVTSIPVVSRIFVDLGILNTRLARLVLGVAVLEDMVLWVALALATAAAGETHLTPGTVGTHIASTVAFCFFCVLLASQAAKRVSRLRELCAEAPISVMLVLLLAFAVLATALGISVVLAAFCAGLTWSHASQGERGKSLDALRRVGDAFFIPAYFVVIGLRLNLARDVSVPMILMFFAGSCFMKTVSVTTAGYLAGYRRLDLVNIAITTNARGGPGIVVASVAFDAQIISATFYTTLVIVAIVTSQIAGAWLEFVIRKNWPLLEKDYTSTSIRAWSQ